VSTMGLRNRAAVIAVLFVVLTAADDQTRSKNSEESADNNAVIELQDGNTADGQLLRLNDTKSSSNDTVHSTTPVPKPTTPEPPKNEPILPEQTGVKAQEEEQSSGMSIFFSLLVIGICIVLVHLLIKFKLHFLPESVAVVSLGILMGAFIKIIESQQLANWKMKLFALSEGLVFAPFIPGINISLIVLFAVCLHFYFFLMHIFIVLADVSCGRCVYFSTAEGFAGSDVSTGWETFMQALGYFLKMFFGSAALGTLTGLISAIVLKHFDLRKTPSLEFGMMIIFAYLPYGLAEGIKLSGIMAILFSGIVMSHYTHHNLSPVTQILMQQTLRTVAFMCETCVFAFLGLSIFSFPHKFELSFVIWCIVLVLVGRAVNIFPLSFLLNFFRDHKINPKMMFVMWFSGLRGAIPYALSLHLGLEPIEKRQLIGTTTIVIVLFTILLLGGGTMPLIRIMDIEESQSRRKNKKDINLSKTEKMGNAIESEHLSELTEEEYEAQIFQRQDLKGFLWLDAKYLNPFFTRRLTQEDLLHGRIQMKTLTNKWYEEVRQGPSGSEDEDDEAELL
uniref:Solute carrier family 9 member 8 n=2 Tax=Sinocyclocheilus grahami TaxID=75366 RepID=A0A672JTL8_SINGR